MTHCSHCGTLNRDDSKYCKDCGTRLSPPAPLLCRLCSSPNPIESVFCNKCGARLKSPTRKSASERNQPVSPVNPFPTLFKPPETLTPSSEDAPSAKGDSSPSKEQFLPLSPPPAASTPGRIAPSLLRRENVSPIKAGLIPTHELIRMVNALGIDVDYSTLRFWQKRGLIPPPIRGPVDSGRGTRGYYDPSLIDRLRFIREIQKTYSMGLDAIREELERIDRQKGEASNAPMVRPYEERLTALQAQREAESKKTLLAVLSKTLGVDPEEIATIVIGKKDGQTLRFFPGKSSGEPEH